MVRQNVGKNKLGVVWRFYIHVHNYRLKTINHRYTGIGSNQRSSELSHCRGCIMSKIRKSFRTTYD